MSSNPYNFFNRFVLRFPVYSSEKLLNKKIDVFKEFQSDIFFRDAICNASYSFYKQMTNFLKAEATHQNKEREKFEISLYKYYSRMCTRSTPFGFFSGVQTGIVSSRSFCSAFQIDPKQIEVKQEYDNLFLYNIIKENFNAENEDYYLFSNNTVNKYFHRYRYVEEMVKNPSGEKSFRIVQTEYNPILRRILKDSKNGINKSTLIRNLLDSGYNYSELDEYITELVKNNLLIVNINPEINLKYFEKLNVFFKDISYNDNLKNLLSQYTLLQNDHSKRIETKYEEILSITKKDFPDNSLFNCTATIRKNEIVLDRKFFMQIRKLIPFFNKISPLQNRGNLMEFINKFHEKYEFQEIPLLEVLDRDIGIGFPVNNGHIIKNEFIDDLKKFISSKEITSKSNIVLNDLERTINTKIIKAFRENERIIQLKDEDFESNNQWSDLPVTIYGSAKLFYEKGKEKIAINGFSGSSAVNLLARFSFVNEGIKEYIDEIVELEQKQQRKEHKKSVIAEIVFIPDVRISNVIEHPVFYDYFIPIMNNPALLNPAKPIHLDDLFLRLSPNKRLVLWSKSLKAEVVPRLTNAHNYSKSDLDIYKFLCELQHQGQRSFIGFSFGALAGLYSFIPRFEYNGIVISEARWFIDSSEINHIKKTSDNKRDMLKGIEALWSRYKLPRYVLFVYGDNELLIDITNEISVQILVKESRKLNKVELKEFLLRESYLKDREGQQYSHEILVAFYKNNE
ncbi:lantibiotic dehydratase family protein [Elizabethkingia meningoseptica]|uniref:lantibiotic dehydratase family protein n=1 Tax=Elizabethkingia meningoseptica TaxID=238 RepID=UPI0023AF6008|nr:lantibiotic dehydratase family protein [Elizabethkingia meningoseptica]MDE5432193.1 lantibiotic dehydratase family protein [Elizabethkingia meningoseptica]